MTLNRNQVIIELYRQGKSSNQIHEEGNYKISIRQIQRIIKLSGITRSKSQSFNLAIKQGRMKFKKKPINQLKKRKTIPKKLRYKILEKYNFKCCKCGNTAETDRIQIDHIDNNPANNKEENLQVLCESCNHGKN